MFNGSAWVYFPGLGVCGETHADADLVAGVSLLQFLGGAHGGDEIQVTGENGATTTATVATLCVTCLSGDIDLSPAAFDKLAPRAKGRIKVTWDFI